MTEQPSHLGVAALMSDGELVARVLAGDQASYQFLVQRHQDSLYRVAYSLVFDDDVAADLVQDAFVRAYDRITECRDRAHFRAWLFRIARNLCLDHLKNIRRQSVPLSAVDAAAGRCHDRDEMRELDLTLRSALDRLPVAVREAFLLKHDAGYTYDEVAAMTQASPKRSSKNFSLPRALKRPVHSNRMTGLVITARCAVPAVSSFNSVPSSMPEAAGVASS